jgi:hypothetical protein
MRILRGLNLTLSFVLELAFVAADTYWCLTLKGWIHVLLGALAAVVAIAFWAIWMAPNATRRIGWPIRPIVALVLFVVAALALLDRGHLALGWSMIVLTFVNAAGVLAWRQDTADSIKA